MGQGYFINLMMKYLDVFNGDADGICALHQLRLTEPRHAELITGPKRDVKLLKKIVGTTNASITVLDVSMQANKDELLQLLGTNKVEFFDHHFADGIPDSGNLVAHVDPAADICTSLIVDRFLGGRYRAWAVVGAFGDNLHDAAITAAAGLNWSEAELADIRELGELMNYNGYGANLEDLHFTPQELYGLVKPYKDPLEFLQKSDAVEKLRTGFNADMELARSVAPIIENEAGRIFRFPAESWSRRVAGVFSNEKARERPELAHALVVEKQDNTYLISVRAPLSRKAGADKLCLLFPTGGGRAAAAGINSLPGNELNKFISSFEEIFSQ